MKYKRIEPGHYRNEDGRVDIYKEHSDNFNGRRYVRETVWSIVVDGKSLIMCEMTKRDAVEVAERKLKEISNG